MARRIRTGHEGAALSDAEATAWLARARVRLHSTATAGPIQAEMLRTRRDLDRLVEKMLAAGVRPADVVSAARDELALHGYDLIISELDNTPE